MQTMCPPALTAKGSIARPCSRISRARETGKVALILLVLENLYGKLPKTYIRLKSILVSGLKLSSGDCTMRVQCLLQKKS